MFMINQNHKEKLLIFAQKLYEQTYDKLDDLILCKVCSIQIDVSELEEHFQSTKHQNNLIDENQIRGVSMWNLYQAKKYYFQNIKNQYPIEQHKTQIKQYFIQKIMNQQLLHNIDLRYQYNAFQTISTLFIIMFFQNENYINQQIILKFNEDFKNNLFYSIEALILLSKSEGLQFVENILIQQQIDIQYFRDYQAVIGCNIQSQQFQLDKLNVINFTLKFINDLYLLKHLYLSFVIAILLFTGITIDLMVKLKIKHFTITEKKLQIQYRNDQDPTIIKSYWIPKWMQQFIKENIQRDINDLEYDNTQETINQINILMTQSLEKLIQTSKCDEYKEFLNSFNIRRLLYISKEIIRFEKSYQQQVEGIDKN